MAIGGGSFLVEFIVEDGCPTFRARFSHRLFPRGEFAIRVAAASVERSALGPAHHNFARAALFRTRDAQSLLLDIFALWIVAASREGAVAAVLNHKVPAVLRAFLIQHLIG